MATVFVDWHGGVLSVLSEVGRLPREVNVPIDSLSTARLIQTGPRLHANAMRMEVNPIPTCDVGVRRQRRAKHSLR